MSYHCPHCGADDSGHCDFRISVRTETVVPSKQEAARKAGCRVMHYTDLRAAEEKLDAQVNKAHLHAYGMSFLASYRQLTLLSSLQAANYPLAPGPRGTDTRTILN